MDIKTLIDLFEYNKDTGVLTRKTTSGRFKKGDEAGCEAFRAGITYRVVSANGKRLLAHRVAWALHYGVWPKCIDHINGVGTDNRICNLRDVTHTENMRNMRLFSTNKTGVCGVCYDSKRKKFRASIVVNGKQRHVGYFNSLDEAKKHREKASEENGFHIMHGNK